MRVAEVRRPRDNNETPSLEGAARRHSRPPCPRGAPVSVGAVLVPAPASHEWCRRAQGPSLRQTRLRKVPGEPLERPLGRPVAGNVARRSPHLPAACRRAPRPKLELTSASITKRSATMAQDDALMPSCDNGRSLTGAKTASKAWSASTAAQPSGRGAASHVSPRWRRGGAFTAPDAVRALRDATTLTAPLRGHRSRPVRLL